MTISAAKMVGSSNLQEYFDNQRGKKGGLPRFQEDFHKVLFILLHGALQEISQLTHICAVHLNKQSNIIVKHVSDGGSTLVI